MASLTGLRFAGALLVLLHHLPLALPAVSGPLRVAQCGYVGVTFFFVLSGFVLGYGWDESFRARDFYVRRGARVYPVHLLTVALIIAVLWKHGVLWQVLPLNLMLIQAWSPNATVYYSFVGAAWSLSCEAFFYLCFPALVRLLKRCRRPVVHSWGLVVSATAVGLAAKAFWPAAGEYLFHVPIFRISDFTVGILLSVAVRAGWRPRLGRRAALALCITVYLAVLSQQVLSGSGPEMAWLYSILMVMPFGLLIAAVAGKELDGHKSVLGSAVPVMLGQWSFALYMIHGVVLAALHESVRGLTGSAAVVVSIAIVVLAVAAARLVFVLYERPLEAAIRQRWGQRAVRTSLRPSVASR
ncbi:acyltransferase [Terrabacter sp. NPDC080008]|uniref:acyltransferase family protein n=1 Tax=Terrabacter sp. NPDC080008 TaxID=3155176 RepID=UPI00344EEB07